MITHRDCAAIVTLVLLSACTVACTNARPPSLASAKAALLELHAAGLAAHLEGDVDALLATQAEDFVLVNGGEISSPSRTERREFFGPYLAATRFDVYRDRVPPIVQVSPDGRLGWVIAEVEARGANTAPDGRVTPVEFIAAWIELYEQREGRWVSVGNVSSFRT